MFRKFVKEISLKVVVPHRKKSLQIKIDPTCTTKNANLIREKVQMHLDKHRGVTPASHIVIDSSYQFYFQKNDAVIDETLPLSVYQFKDKDRIFLQRIPSQSSDPSLGTSSNPNA